MIAGLTGAVKDYVKVDNKFDLDQTAAVARRFTSFNGDSIKNWSLPIEEGNVDGQSVLFLRPEPAVPTLNIFRGLDPHDAEPRTVKFAIENGTGKNGQAAQVQEAFRAVGYQAEVGGSTVAPTARTTIRYGFGGQDVASQIERHLTAGATITGDPELGVGEVVLVTGDDFTTVMRRPRPWVPPAAPPSPEPDASASTTPKAPATTEAPTTTKPPLTNTGDEFVGYVPAAPPGVECD
jgi:hypothetical protein